MNGPKKKGQLIGNAILLCITVCTMRLIVEVLVSAFSEEVKWVGADKLYYEHDSVLGWKNPEHENSPN